VYLTDIFAVVNKRNNTPRNFQRRVGTCADSLVRFSSKSYKFPRVANYQTVMG